MILFHSIIWAVVKGKKSWERGQCALFIWAFETCYCGYMNNLMVQLKGTDWLTENRNYVIFKLGCRCYQANDCRT